MGDRVFSHTSTGGATLTVTEYAAADVGPCLVFDVVDPALGAAVAGFRYSDVESLHAALGAWLMDKLVTGAVTERQRWGK